MPKKILLADDSITIQKVVELTFSDGDYEVTAVNNGAKAVLKLSEMRPDIILSDIIMPEKNGYEVCEYVKSHPEFRNIPVVLLTGTFEPFDPDRAEKAGCDAVVTKPFESQSLIHKVEELIAQAQYSNSAPAAAPAPVAEGSPWMDEPVAPSQPVAAFPAAAPEPFGHDSDIFGAAPPQATTEMPFDVPPAPAFGGPSFGSTEMPFDEPPAAVEFAGETRAFPRMTFEEMQKMAAAPEPAPAPAPPPPPAPAPEASPWDEPAALSGETRAFERMSFDDFAPPAPAAPAAPAADADAPFGAPPPAEEFSSETRAFTRMSIEEMQQMVAGQTLPPEDAASASADAASSPWDEPAAPAFGDTPAFNDYQEPVAPTPAATSSWDQPAPFESQPEAPAFGTEAASPFGGEAEVPAFGGETRAFPKLSFDDFQQMGAAPEPEPAPSTSAWTDAPSASTSAWTDAPAPSTSAWNDAPAYDTPAFDTPAFETPAFEAPAPTNAPEHSPLFDATPAPSPFGGVAPAFEEPAATSWSDAPEPAFGAPEESFSSAAPVEDAREEAPAEPPFAPPVAEEEPEPEPAWMTAAAMPAPEPLEEEPELADFSAPAAASTPAPVPSAPGSGSDLTDEQIDRIARRVVELMSDKIVRNIAWEVIPDLAEMVVKERIRQLEAEA